MAHSQRITRGVVNICDRVQAQYDAGRMTVISDRAMGQKVQAHLDDWLQENEYEI